MSLFKVHILKVEVVQGQVVKHAVHLVLHLVEHLLLRDLVDLLDLVHLPHLPHAAHAAHLAHVAHLVHLRLHWCELGELVHGHLHHHWVVVELVELVGVHRVHRVLLPMRRHLLRAIYDNSPHKPF